MARFVVDANVVVQACIDAAGLGPLTGHKLLAPPILRSEALSSLHEMLYRGDISVALADHALEALKQLPVSSEEPDGLWHRAWQISEALGWAKTYDAEYVALAQILDCPLVTLDSRLARGAARAARVMGPADL